MVNIEKYLIISQEQFNILCESLNCTLIPTDKEYLLAYLFTNFLAYFVIIISIYIIMTIYYKLFHKKKITGGIF